MAKKAREPKKLTRFLYKMRITTNFKNATNTFKYLLTIKTTI